MVAIVILVMRAYVLALITRRRGIPVAVQSVFTKAIARDCVETGHLSTATSADASSRPQHDQPPIYQISISHLIYSITIRINIRKTGSPSLNIPASTVLIRLVELRKRPKVRPRMRRFHRRTSYDSWDSAITLTTSTQSSNSISNFEFQLRYGEAEPCRVTC